MRFQGHQLLGRNYPKEPDPSSVLTIFLPLLSGLISSVGYMTHPDKEPPTDAKKSPDERARSLLAEARTLLYSILGWQLDVLINTLV